VRPLDPASAIAEVERLAARLAGGTEVTRGDLDRTLEPFRPPGLADWREPDLERLAGALLHLKNALIARYQIADDNGICTEDSWVFYSACGPGYACLASVELRELRCLLWLSGR
jgi:hypothetical protein